MAPEDRHPGIPSQDRDEAMVTASPAERVITLEQYLDVVNALFVANQKIAALEAQLQDKQPPPQVPYTQPPLFED